MIAVVQRVLEARVRVADRIVGEIGPGMAVLAAVHKTDTTDDVNWMAQKLVAMRILRNADRHFDLDVRQINGSILLVSNFTVAAATRQGRRPSLDAAADPATGRKLFDDFITAVIAQGVSVATGEFGADMRVELVNDGPVTFIVDSRDGTSRLSAPAPASGDAK